MNIKDFQEKRGRKPLDIQMEAELKEWIEHKIEEKNYLTRSIIREKARRLSKCERFIASRGWFSKFFRRNPDLEQKYKENRKNHFKNT